MSGPHNNIAASCLALAVAFAVFWLGTIEATFAAGFSDPFQSPGAASVANAGETAIAEDAVTIFYNPAGMTMLSKPEAVLASAIVLPSTRFSNGGTVDVLGNLIHGSVGTNPQQFLPPILFVTAPITDHVTIEICGFIRFG